MTEEPRRPPTWKQRVPWPLRFGGKLAATHLPALRSAARRVGGFDHGPMDQARYVRYWVETHVRRTGLPDLRGLSVLELGPGDSIGSALVARSLGAQRVILIDVAPFASRDLAVYRRLAETLAATNPQTPDISGVTTFDELLDVLCTTYLTEGLSSLRALAPSSIDVSWSQAVLEHVRLDDIAAVVNELHRIHRPRTTTSHRIDFQDHLDRSLNSLRFPDRVWESALLRKADFYTNRLRRSEMLALFGGARFDVTVLSEQRWQHLPVERRQLATRFRSMPAEDLLTWELDLTARRE